MGVAGVCCAMPKEFVHFNVARKAARQLRTGPLGPDLDAHQELFLLGAVFHDALFYLETPGHQEPEALLRLPHQLHGQNGHDPYALLRAQATRAASTQAAEDRAFLAGMVTHVCTDVTLHPLIYYLSGNYHEEPQAVERHRLLESCLDIAVAGSLRELRRSTLYKMIGRADPVRHAPCSFLAQTSGCSKDQVRAALHRSWKTFARMNRLALSLPGRMTAALRPLLPPDWRTVREVAALFYPPPSLVASTLRTLQSPLRFQHPVTGHTQHTNVAALLSKAAQSAVRLCRDLEPALFGDADPKQILGRGPNLDTGLPGQAADKAIYFAHPRFPPL